MARDYEALKARVHDVSYTPGTDALRRVGPLLLQAQDLTATAMVRLPLLGEAFLHRSRVSLGQAPIDHGTAAECAAIRQELGSDEDHTALDEGVPAGCSPWACRGDADPLTQDDFGLAT
ncbi:hypothetical protein [Streptomyces sp. NBC_01767]|uniref:hypothetical protein n=1 Tax=Streptomyces sp. NBC_01767 TaxID=2975937 RepID=UPI002B1CD209|nr:hypothetical protein [Streptomyces sp. NBC_01767]